MVVVWGLGLGRLYGGWCFVFVGYKSKVYMVILPFSLLHPLGNPQDRGLSVGIEKIVLWWVRCFCGGLKEMFTW